MNMFQSTKATTISEYLAQLPPDRLEPITFLHEFIQKTVPQLKPYFANNMLGYGSFPYKNYKKEAIEWPVVALANQKKYMSLYVCSVQEGKYLAETFSSKLGKVSVGKSCIRFKKIADLNLETLATLLQSAAKHPGLQ